MTDQQIKDTIRGFLKAGVVGDTKQALSYLAEDAVWVAPQGTFKGIAQIEKFITWINKMTKDYKITETGINIMTRGDTGVIEHNLSGITDGMKWQSPAVCIYEFKNEKMANIRTFSDQLGQAQQAAKGMFAKWAVNAVANGAHKGLR